MSIKYLVSSFSLVILFLSGCQSGSSDYSNTSINNTSSGYLVDANITGVEYSNKDTNIRGTTDSSGKFTFVDNSTLTFNIGGLKLGELNTKNIKSDKIIYPTDLLGLDRNETNNTKTIKLIRMLQSLDNDNNPYNGIEINSTIATQLQNSTLDFTNDSLTIEDINTTLSDLNKTLISEVDALIHYEYTLQSNGLAVDTIAPLKPIILTTIPNQIITESFDLNISGERGTTIFVNDINTTNKIDINGSKIITLDTTGVNGNKHFSIKLKDDAGFYSEDVNLTLYKNVNIAPVATFSSFSTDEDIAYNGTLTGTDENNDSLTFSKVLDVLNGTLTLTSNGAFTYTPNPNYYGDDSFSYKVSDFGLDSNSTIVHITVESVLDNITGKTYNKTINEDETLTFSSTIINDSFTNVDNLTLSKIKVTTLPTHGTLKLSGTNITLNQEITSTSFANITYTPTANYAGSDSFKISGYDGTVWSDNSTINLTVTNVNDAPVITTSTAITANENQTDAFTITATDADSDTLIYSISGTDYSKFNVDSATGVVTFKTAPDKETKSTYSLTIKASDSKIVTSLNIIITIENIAESIPTISNFSASIYPNAIEDIEIGTINIISSGDTDITSIELDGSGSSNFSVSTSGVITLNNALQYDYNTNSYSFIATATNDAGTSSGTTVDIEIKNPKIKKLVPEDNDDYGISVATYGNYIYVGDSVEKVVFVYNIQKELVTRLTHTTANFGKSIATNGSKLVVAADGKFYIYTQTGSSFSAPVEITPTAIDSITINSANIFVGDITNDKVYKYTLTGTLSSTTDITDPNSISASSTYLAVAIGTSVKIYTLSTMTLYGTITTTATSASINGSYLAIGNATDTSNTGKVSIYKDFVLNSTIYSFDKESGDKFGQSVALSDSYLVVGAPDEDPDGYSNAGSAYIFSK